MKILDSTGNPSKQLFLFLKYNKLLDKADKMADADERLYEEFCKKWREFCELFEDGKAPSATLGGVMSLFGFKRHYCGTCGRPIIGRFSKIGSMITCESCFESYRIIQELEKQQLKLKEAVLPPEKPTKKSGAKKSDEKTPKDPAALETTAPQGET